MVGAHIRQEAAPRNLESSRRWRYSTITLIDLAGVLSAMAWFQQLGISALAKWAFAGALFRAWPISICSIKSVQDGNEAGKLRGTRNYFRNPSLHGK